jgi:hypothetical protein
MKPLSVKGQTHFAASHDRTLVAVSQNCILRIVRLRHKFNRAEVPPITNRRYSRVQLCAALVASSPLCALALNTD